MRPRFEPDVEPELNPPLAAQPALRPNDVPDARSVSLREAQPRSRASFVVECPADSGQPGSEDSSPRRLDERAVAAAPPPQPQLLPVPDSEDWRDEVTARFQKYRSRRRPRSPRYPSLQLKFDSPEYLSNPEQPRSRLAVAIAAPGVLPDSISPEPEEEFRARAQESDSADAAARVLKFPRSSTVPPVLYDDLAEPVSDRLRILEVPDSLPPPPALGGILIEPANPSAADEKLRRLESRRHPAPIARRVAAGAADGLLVLSAVTAFAWIFWRTTGAIPPLRHVIGAAGALMGLLWAAYQYLLLVYAGITPGLRLAKLRLTQFDGYAVTRKTRRWRVLASVLSGLSLGLGYVWCLLDEDQLCWHDRITHTLIAPRDVR